MTPETPASLPARYTTPTYIGVVVLVALGLGCYSYLRYGWPADWVALVVLAFLGALTWWLPSTSSDGRIHFTADNVVVLAAIPIVGPLGAGVVGLAMAVLTRRRIALHRRLFNVAMASASAMVGGIAYDLAGGSLAVDELHGALQLVLHVGLPIVVADAVNLLANAVLVAGVIRLTAGVPLQLQLVDMLTSSGLTQFAYGIIAFLVVIMWLPGELGPVAVLVALAPLAGARWALLQYGEERDARERALGALVTAIETRAPVLEGHSGRVSTMAALMAQELGLGPKEVADVRTAGLLHDLGRVVVAPGQEGVDQAGGAALRGAAMLQSLPFLAGASSVMEEVARAEASGAELSLAADIVRAADEFDLILHGEDRVSPSAAIARVRERRPATAEADRMLAALARVARLHDGSGEGMVTTS
ncbi:MULTISPECIES: HD domain-containing protein [unclassified Knoellia]|uniref:HD domain-containing protein n=1 Tax=Knoellia altitudinis TaxID=3404795 RepID=UPI00361A155D